MEFLKRGFDVTTATVLNRAKASMNPLMTHQSETFNQSPDIYGPFWITTTSIFAMTISANCGQWLKYDDTLKFAANFRMTCTAACIMYGRLFLVPGLLYLLSCRSSNAVNLDYKLIVCIYGYSTLPLIPACIICSVPISILQTITVIIGFAISITTCFKYLWMAAVESLSLQVRGTLLTVAVIGQVINWGVYYFYLLKTAN